jgi:hypothetical protein
MAQQKDVNNAENSPRRGMVFYGVNEKKKSREAGSRL